MIIYAEKCHKILSLFDFWRNLDHEISVTTTPFVTSYFLSTWPSVICMTQYDWMQLHVSPEAGDFEDPTTRKDHLTWEDAYIYHVKFVIYIVNHPYSKYFNKKAKIIVKNRKLVRIEYVPFCKQRSCQQIKST